MTKPLNPLAIVAIIAVVVVVLVIIGYKTVAPAGSPERTDAAHRDIIASMTGARAAAHKGMPPARP